MRRAFLALLLLGALSVNAGENAWTSVGPLPIGSYRGFAADPMDANTVYVATTGLPGVWRSRNRGATWENVGVGTALESAGLIQQVMIDPVNSSHLLVLSFSGFHQSFDSGAHWLPASFMSSSFFAGGAEAFATSRDLRVVYVALTNFCLFGCSFGGVVKSTDGGSTFKKAGLNDQNVHYVAADPFDANRAYAITVDKDWIGRVQRTVDGGGHWTALSPILNLLNSGARLMVDPTDPHTLYLATSEGLRISNNSGDTWSLRRDAPFTLISAFAADPRSPTIIYAATPGEAPAPPGLPGLPPPPPPTPALVGIIQTTDRGQTWTPVLKDPLPEDARRFALTDVHVDATRMTFYQLGAAGLYQFTIRASRRRPAKP